jgi:hypothetical protein
VTAATQLESSRSDAAGPLRAELQVASVASGLLLLLDAHRLTGRLPLEIQVQVGRLRHAVKMAIQAQAGRATPAPSPASVDPAQALRAWITAQPWAQPGPQGWVYLLCFRDPATGQHRPLQGQGVGASTPATTGAGPRTSSAASTSTATPAGPAPAASSRSPSPPG